jgi:predicted neuraminidase
MHAGLDGWTRAFLVAALVTFLVHSRTKQRHERTARSIVLDLLVIAWFTGSTAGAALDILKEQRSSSHVRLTLNTNLLELEAENRTSVKEFEKSDRSYLIVMVVRHMLFRFRMLSRLLLVLLSFITMF